MKSVTCPACGTKVGVTKANKLVTHDRKPDDGKAERCRWSGEPVELTIPAVEEE